MKQKYVVNIGGNSLTVISDEEEEYVKSLAQILDRRVMDMVIVKNKCSKAEALMLCALDYLDSTVKLKAEVEDLKEKLHEQQNGNS